MRTIAALLLVVSDAAAPPPDPSEVRFKIDVAETVLGRDWTETVLRFPSPAKSPWAANDVVWAHLLVPASAVGRRLPAVLILPVMAAPNVWIETRFADRFVQDGLAVMWLEMPTQFHRRPDPSEPSGQVFLARTPKQLAANFRQSVLDARRALGVLAGRPEVDPDRIALFGISLGAIVGATAYAADPRPRFGVFLLGGADFPSLLVDSSLTGPFAQKMGLKPDALRTAWAGLDLLEHPERNAGKRVLLVNAAWDTVIPKPNALKLKAAFPDARQVWLPGGHYSAILHLIWLPRWISGVIRGALNADSGKKTIKADRTP